MKLADDSIYNLDLCYPKAPDPETMETPDPPNDTPGALKQVVLTPHGILWSLRVIVSKIIFQRIRFDPIGCFFHHEKTPFGECSYCLSNRLESKSKTNSCAVDSVNVGSSNSFQGNVAPNPICLKMFSL